MKNVYISTVQHCSISISGAIKSVVSRIKTDRLRTGVTVITSVILVLFSINTKAQTCPSNGTHSYVNAENTYFPGTASVSAGATTISLGISGTGTNFGTADIAVGDIVLIIQMQGSQISVTTNSQATTYGSGTSGLSSGFTSTNLVAGKMEFAVATNSISHTAGGNLTIASGLTNAYVSSAYNSAVPGGSGKYTFQVIRVPQYYNIILSTTVTAPKWNGSTGGVLVISAINQLNLNGKNISAVGAGFRGGSTANYSGASGSYKDRYTLSTATSNGGKGEGISGTPRLVYATNTQTNTAIEGYPGGSNARGAPGTAGGGATDSDPASNSQNAGGGGGGNGGSGGTGGDGWSSGGQTGGFGGSAFSIGATNYHSPNRLVMGGGGGSGSTNNASGYPGGGVASSGSPGGGLIIINSTSITGTSTIDASADTANNSVTVDGSGGGGAGGSILIYAGSGHSGITAVANGGNGSDNHPKNLDATQHGPGGGGGGGVIYSNGTLNVASSVNFGNAGTSYGTTATDSYDAKPGSVGVLTQTYPFAQLPPNMQICQTVVLPVKMLSFTATLESAELAKITWSTTDEVNADYFEVERSANGTSFSSVAQVYASNSVSQVHTYSINDPLSTVSSEIVYYRLRIVDLSGKSSFTNVVALRLDQPANTVSVYPNPVDGYTTLSIYAEKQTSGMYRLIDNSGKQILTKSFNAYKGTNSITIDNLGSLSRGIYFLQILIDNKLYNQKIVKR